MSSIYDWPIDGVPSEYIFGEEDGRVIGHEGENWKETVIPEILVSDHGRFLNSKTGRLLKPTHGDGHGHKAVKFCVNGERKQFYAHREIAKAFVQNPNNEPIVRHLNDDPSDNVIENLSWGTQKDNHLDAVRNGSYKPFTDEDREKSFAKSRKPIEVTNERTGEKKKYRSINDAARDIGCQQSNLSKVLNGERPRTMGYIARKITKEEYYEGNY